MSSTLNNFLQALPWNQAIELPDQHQWKYANQPALLEWSLKARPYDTRVANIMFLSLLTIITLVFVGAAHKIPAHSLLEKLIGIPFYLLTMGGGGYIA